MAASPSLAPSTPALPAAPSTIGFASANYTLNERDEAGIITLEISPSSSVPVTVTLSSADIPAGAEASQDFVGLRQSLVIPPNQTSYTLSVQLLDDTLVEGDEMLNLTLSNYQAAVPGAITETAVTIVDDDYALLSIHDVTVEEADGQVELLIVQSVASTIDTDVLVRTVDGNATTPHDYASLVTTVTIPAGSVNARVHVQLYDDGEAEGTESFTVQLENPINAQLADATATITLTDDDTFPKLTFAPAEATEMTGVLRFVATLNQAWPHAVTVEYSTRNGTAIAPDDYLPTSSVLTFAPGQMTAAVTVTLVNDDKEEPAENLFIDFTNPAQATLSSVTVEGIVRDNFAESLFLPALQR